MIILGINAYHPDSSACLLRDGELVAAAEEERFRRIKHWAGFPSHAVAYCLKEAGLRLADVTCVAVNRNNRANLARKIALCGYASSEFEAGVSAPAQSLEMGQHG
jgi:carbamoyltransferase